MSDLLENGLGDKKESTKGEGESSTPNQTSGNGIVGHTDHDNRTPGEDLTGTTTKPDSDESSKTSTNEGSSQVDSKNSESTSSSTEETVNNPDSWTMDSALKEIKKLRKENEAARKKFKEKVNMTQEEMNKRIEEERKQYQDAVEAQKELENLKAKEEDKKRSLEEKLAHREKRLGEVEARLESTEKTYKQQLEEAQSRIKQYEAEQEAQMAVYKERLEEELNSIPEDKKEVADLIVRGAGDARDALVALNEAKHKGIFDEKQVVVNHSVPGAKEGARVSQDQMDEAAKQAKEKMGSKDLIRAGLQQSTSKSKIL